VVARHAGHESNAHGGVIVRPKHGGLKLELSLVAHVSEVVHKRIFKILC
jgi:hypothetical protein